LEVAIRYISQQQSRHQRFDALLFWMSITETHQLGGSRTDVYPNKRILATKLDVKAAYQRCHLIASIATQTCTQIPSEGLALMMLWLTFGGAPCPLEWGFIAESICNLANAILLSDDWDPLSLQSPNQHLVPDKIILDDDIPFGIGQDLIVEIPVNP
jgi:hypothetical protein